MSTIGVIGISSPELARYAQFYSNLTMVKRPATTALAHATGQVISVNRNTITEQALAAGAEWIWYVDDDHVFQPDTLLKLLERNVDIVSGLYLQRAAPYVPHRYIHEEPSGAVWTQTLAPGDTGLSEVLATGAGCLLVKTAVFMHLKPPYWRLGQLSSDVWGDDIDFCQRARAAGFKIWCDLDVPVGHYVIHSVVPARNADDVWTTQLMEGQTHIATFPAATRDAR